MANYFALLLVTLSVWAAASSRLSKAENSAPAIPAQALREIAVDSKTGQIFLK